MAAICGAVSALPLMGVPAYDAAVINRPRYGLVWDHSGLQRVLIRATGLVVVIVGLLPSAPAVAEKAPPREAGWLQSVRLEPHRLRMRAKLDTGAKSNALHARDIELFTQAGVRRVRFHLFEDHVEQSGKKLIYDLPVKRTVRVKRRGDLPSDERVTVSVSFCLDGELERAEFSLYDRSNFNYAILLGRSFLAGRFLVNSAETFVLGSDCPE